MKKILLCLLMVLGIGHAKSQIIITGFMSDPAGSDATSTSPGFEYVQLMATETITFSPSNAYSVVFARNFSSSSTDSPFSGWNTGGTRTYKFNLTSGTVNKGEFFYVGGSEKVIAGYLRFGSPAVTYKSTDISGAKWIRAIGYRNDAGDGFGDIGVSDWLSDESGRLAGIAVFAGTTVSNTTVPLDAVFFGDATYLITKLLDVANSKGYMVPNNDLYKVVDGSTPQPYYGQGTNTTVFAPQPAADKGYFAKLGGVYNTSANKWTTARNVSYVMLLDGTSTNAADALVPQLSDIETDVDINKVTRLSDVPLPVNLVSFEARKQENRVLLNWITASEQKNHHFDVLRSADGINFKVIDTKPGGGTSSNPIQYQCEDNNPVQGVNYYKLRQVDYDNSYTESGVVSVFYNIGASESLKVYANKENNTVTILLSSSMDEQGIIIISDITGKKLAKQKIAIVNGAASLDIPVNLQNKVYVATFSSQTKQLSTKFMP